MSGPATVLIADDHAVVAEALATALGRWFKVVGIVTVLDRLDGEIHTKRPKIVVLDLTFGKDSAIPILRKLVDQYPDTRFVVLTAHAEPVLADGALRAGALGFVVKESSATELRIAIEEALEGRTFLSPLMQAKGAGGNSTPAAAQGVLLTDRQRSILGLLRQGLTHSVIAGKLQISTKTVEYHVDVMGRRLGVVGRVQLVRWAEKFYPNDEQL
jgi:DNA-binding NarL/FixJ family response regulator